MEASEHQYAAYSTTSILYFNIEREVSRLIET